MEANPPCHRCQQDLGPTRYAESGLPLCSSCFDHLSAPPRWTTGRALLQTVTLGGLAGTLLALGAAVIIVLTGRDFAIYWILVGGLIARACKRASDRRSGLGFRLLAMTLLYGSIGTSWLLCFAYWGLFGFPSEKAETDSRMPFAQMLQLPHSTPTPQASATPEASGTTPEASATPLAAPREASAPPRKSRLLLGLVAVPLLALLVVLGSPLLVMYSSPVSILIYGLAMSQVWKAMAPEVGELTGPTEG